jgi:hypothetical protein
MHSLWRWFGTLLLIVAGCRTSPLNLKPPPQPEEYNKPPENDKRYDRPYEYPKDDDPSNPMRKSANGQGVTPIKGPRTPGMTPGGF